MAAFSGEAARGRRMRWLLVAGVIVVRRLCAPRCAYMGMTLLGTRADTTRRGTVEFGTGGSGCNIDGTASSFPSGTASIYEVAHFAREVSEGEVVTFKVSQAGTELASVPRTFDAVGNCLGGTLPGGLPPGPLPDRIPRGHRESRRGGVRHHAVGARQRDDRALCPAPAVPYGSGGQCGSPRMVVQ